MSLNEFLKGMNIPAEEVNEIIKLASENPMAAMAKLQQYLTPEMIQSMMQMMMSDPEAMQKAMKQAGVSEEDLENIKKQFPTD